MSWSTSEWRVRLAPFNRLSPPVKYFTDRSKAVILLWIFYVFVLSCVCYVFVRVCLYVICGHLLGKGWPLGSRLWCLLWVVSLSHWYPGSGVVLDCIDSWSLHLNLLAVLNICSCSFKEANHWKECTNLHNHNYEGHSISNRPTLLLIKIN